MLIRRFLVIELHVQLVELEVQIVSLALQRVLICQHLRFRALHVLNAATIHFKLRLQHGSLRAELTIFALQLKLFIPAAVQFVATLLKLALKRGNLLV